MKNLKTFAIIAIVILAVSCKKNNNSGGPSGSGTLTMNINGANWVSDDNTAGYIQKTNNKLFFTGRQVSTDETFLISDVSVTATGTFPIVPSSGQISILKNGASYQVRTTYPKSRATIIVTRITSSDNLFNDVEGTFSGVLYASLTDSVVITNGVFKSK